MIRRYMGLLAAILLCEAVGFIGAMSTRTSVATWYRTLEKPPFTPPDWLFGPVWITLYAMMGIALWLTWNRLPPGTALRWPVIWLFGVQLLANMLWSILFFGMQNPVIGLVDIVILWLLILLTIVWMRPVSTPAAILMIPYLLWVSYAVYLNTGIVLLNRGPIS